VTDRTIVVGETTAGPGAGDVEPGLPVELPVVEVLSGRGFGTGKSGSGKSNTGGVVCEELLDRGHSLLVVDIEGEYYSLKENYEVLHVGADEEVDLRVGPEHAEKIASLALEQHIPVVLDVSGYLDEEVRDELVYQVVRHLFAKEKSLRKNFLLVVEEMHEFVPQQGSLGELGKMIIRVAKRGRKRGLGVLGMSQRPANVSKDFITQCDWLVWHRLTWRNETKVVRDVLSAEHADAVPDLEAGEAFLQADFLDPEVRRMQWRRKRTFDAGATPTLDDTESPELMGVDEDLLAELEQISEAADQREDEMEQLRDRVETLQEDLDEKEERIERLLDLREMVDSVDGLGGDRGETVTVEFDGTAFDVPEVIQAEVLEVREEKRELQDELDEAIAERDGLQERVAELEEQLDERQAPEELEQLREDVVELLQRNAGVLDVEAGGRVAELEAELQQLRDEREELDRQVRDEFGDVDELLAHDVVRDRIAEVADASRYANDHTWDAITALAGTEWVGIDAVEPYLGVGRSGTKDVLLELHEDGLADRRKDGRTVEYRLDREALESLVDAYRKRERLKAKREELQAGGGVGE